MLSGINLARARRLEQAQAVARNLFGILVALPLVVDFQTGPFIRVHGVDVRSLELAVGCRLWREQRRVRSVGSQLGRSARFGMSVGADGSGPGLTLNRIEFTVNRIARAPGDRQRAENDREGRKLWDHDAGPGNRGGVFADSQQLSAKRAGPAIAMLIVPIYARQVAALIATKFRAAR
jgi:hypothetical protein